MTHHENSDDTSGHTSDDHTSTAPTTDDENLGGDKTIPSDPDGLAAGHDPDGSNFNQEEDVEGAGRE